MKIDFYMNKTLHRHWRMSQVSAVTILTHFGVGCRKKLDILGGRYLEVRMY